MTRKPPFTTLLITMMGLMLLTQFAHAHDAFYPHHREDFEAMTRRQEVRGLVLIITAGFVSVLVGVFYVAWRKGGGDAQQFHETEQARLERASNAAAQAARAAILDPGATGAIHAALAAYANASGIVWNQNSVRVSGSSIRCKIGSDVVIVNIFHQGEQYQIELDASCDEANVKAVFQGGSKCPNDTKPV